MRCVCARVFHMQGNQHRSSEDLSHTHAHHTSAHTHQSHSTLQTHIPHHTPHMPHMHTIYTHCTTYTPHIHTDYIPTPYTSTYHSHTHPHTSVHRLFGQTQFAEHKGPYRSWAYELDPAPKPVVG